MKKNKLLWLSIILIIVADVLSYFFAGTNIRDLKTQIPIFIIFLIGIFLLIFSLKDLIKKNKKGAIIGFIVGFILGALSYGTGMFLLLFLIPIYSLIGNLVGCGGGGEACWGWYIILSPIILGFTGMLVGIYINNKKSNKK